MLIYILEVTLCWFIFYSIFFLALRKLTFFRVNRWYLLATLTLGLIIPQLRHLEMDVYQEEIAQVAPIIYVIKDAPSQIAYTVTAHSEQVSIDWSILVWTFYLVGFAYFLIRFFRGLLSIRKLYSTGVKRSKFNYTLVTTQEEHLPFSFFRYVFISEQVELKGDIDHVLKHEITHVEGMHSLDVLFLEIVNILFWFNPMIYLYKTALRQTHEYLADHAVLADTSRKQYGTLLLKQSMSGLQIALSHQFFHSHIKKRITMMYQKKSGRSAWLKYALALPVVLIIGWSFMIQENSITAQESSSIRGSFEKEEQIQIHQNLTTASPFENLNDLTYVSYGALDTIESGRGQHLVIKESSSYIDRKQVVSDDNFKNYTFDSLDKFFKEILSNAHREGQYITSKRINNLYHLFYQNNLRKLKDVDAYFNRISEDNGVMVQIEEYQIRNINYKAVYHDYPERYRNKDYSQELALDELKTYYRNINKDDLTSYDHTQVDFRFDALVSRYPDKEFEIIGLFNDYVLEKFNWEDRFLPNLIPTKQVLAPDHLMEFANISDLAKLPYVWVEGRVNYDFPLDENVDLSKPIGSFCYLPPETAVMVFGEKAKHGFYALWDVQRPEGHAITIAINEKREIADFFKTFDRERSDEWSQKLKKFYESHRAKYPQSTDYLEESYYSRKAFFNEQAAKQGIALVHAERDNAIIKVYLKNEEGYERIDKKEEKPRTACSKYDNRYATPNNSSFGKIGCGFGSESRECINRVIQEYAEKFDVFSVEAKKKGFQGYTGLELVIDEEGIPSEIAWSKYNGEPKWGLEEEGPRLLQVLKDHMEFIPSTCNGEAVETMIQFSLYHKLSNTEIASIPKIGASSIEPDTKLSPVGVHFKGDDWKLAFIYWSNMNVPARISIINARDEVVFRKVIPYVYNSIFEDLAIHQLPVDKYTLEVNQDGVVNRDEFEVLKDWVRLKELRDLESSDEDEVKDQWAYQNFGVVKPANEGGPEPDPSCKLDKNGYVFFVNDAFGLVECGPGRTNMDCTQKRIDEFVESIKVYPKKAREEGVQWRLFYELLIDEEGLPERINNIRDYPEPGDEYGFNLESNRIFEHIKDELRFTPSICDGEPQKTRMVLPINFKLSDADIAALPIKNSATVTPETKITITGYSKNQVTFEYHSNMNVLTTYTLKDSEGRIIAEDSNRYFYKKHNHWMEHKKNLAPGAYTLIANQGDHITKMSYTIE